MTVFDPVRFMMTVFDPVRFMMTVFDPVRFIMTVFDPVNLDPDTVNIGRSGVDPVKNFRVTGTVSQGVLLGVLGWACIR